MNRTIFCLLMGVLSLPFAQGADELVIKPKSKETENTLARWEGIFHIYAKGNAKDAETKVTVDCPSGKPLTYYPLVKGKPYEVIKKTNTTEKNYKANDKLAFGSCTIATMTFFDVENGKPQGLPSEIPAKFYVVDSKGKAEDVTHKKPFVLIFKQASIMRRNEFYLVVKPNDYDSKYYSGEYYFKAVFSLKQLQEVTDEAKQKAKTTP